MGNCLTKPNDDQHYQHQQQQQQQKIKKKNPSEIAPADQFSGNRKPAPPSQPPPPEVRLCGDPANPATYCVRFGLQYKPLSLRFFPSQMPLSLFTLRFEDDDPVSGSSETVLQYVESKLPKPPLLVREKEWDDTPSFPVVRMAELQHRSMMWHLERVERWGQDLVTRGGTVAVDPSMGTPRMELRKFGKSYGKLLEVLLEHAQMEERVIFPIFNAADRGLCTSVNEEHARDLPIMNGIKEAIKSIGVLDAGTPNHREALYNLSARLEKLQENCKEHFDEEEKNLFPLMEAAELTMGQQRKAVEQSIDVMQATHSYLFPFFMEGLLPHEALEYTDLLIDCMNKEKAISKLRILVHERDQKGAILENDLKF